MDSNEFVELHKKTLELFGFWGEEYKPSFMRDIESRYHQNIIKEWGISDIIINNDKILLKWFKRHQPLCREEMIKRYGSNYNE